MTETLHSDTEQRRRQEKTPEEVNAQIGRIAGKLMDRAARLDGEVHDHPEEGKSLVGHNRKFSSSQSIVARTRVGGNETSAEWTNNSRKNSAPEAPRQLGQIDKTNKLTYSEQNIGGDPDQYRFKEVSVSFSDAGSHGQYREGDQRLDVPTQNNADNAAKILMKIRGEIANQEIAEENTAQAKVNKLLE